MEKEYIKITQAKYILSAVKKEQYPTVKLPEFAFIGRSNVGKSSLINSLAKSKHLARISAQPGKTQTINFYEMGMRVEERETRLNFYLVDLPGYGYAKTGRNQRRGWERFIEEYWLNSQQLRFVCQLVDIRHSPMASDLSMFHWLIEHQIPVLIVATKADKLSRAAQKAQINLIQEKLGIEKDSILPYSSLKNEGRSDLLDVIATSLLE